ncbi:hypothetical protein [Haliovirga abyssi]|uniref:Type II secretion system protein K n=1 Tax=Haliovirga abyssi TaxID=2996794 RepID=A0AAU9DLH8_9FUSO|nr:hypothetical protein [Haliovirga abyssi]BDU51704.1 hypothetical protein HLVA_22730 [Haliovirga abyssi]
MNTKNRGFILIFILWIISIISLITSYLITNYSFNRKNSFNYINHTDSDMAIISGFNKAISILKNDETKYDFKSDNWNNLFSDKLNNFVYHVKISDVGSLLNINFYSRSDINKNSSKYIPNMILNSNGSDSKYFDVYSKFNFYLYSIKTLEKKLTYDKFNFEEINNIITTFDENFKIKSFNINVTNVINSLNLTAEKKELFTNYFMTVGSLNINILTKEQLNFIFNICKSKEFRNYKSDIIEYMNNNSIDKISSIFDNNIVPKNLEHVFRNIFNTSSNIFSIKISNNNNKILARIVVKRNFKEKKESTFSVLSWNEYFD